MGMKVFAKKWDFLLSVPSLKFLPSAVPPEVAFCGRSNVGKSSLINALTNSKGLARTSNTPGRTQELNFFIPSGEDRSTPSMALVDMPGYGYADAPKHIVEQWKSLVFDYLRGRVTLKRVYLLIDSRHGVKSNDAEVLDMLDKAAISYHIILTKIDKISQKELEKTISNVNNAIAKRPAAYPSILATSTAKNIGIVELRNFIMQVVNY